MKSLKDEVIMRTVDMGLNTEPDFVRGHEIIERWRRQGNEDMVGQWERAIKETEELRDKIIAEVEEHGEVALNWTCTGETRFNMHACQWASAMKEYGYDFEIGRYRCVVRKVSS